MFSFSPQSQNFVGVWVDPDFWPGQNKNRTPRYDNIVPRGAVFILTLAIRAKSGKSKIFQKMAKNARIWASLSLSAKSALFRALFATAPAQSTSGPKNCTVELIISPRKWPILAIFWPKSPLRRR